MPDCRRHFPCLQYYIQAAMLQCLDLVQHGLCVSIRHHTVFRVHQRTGFIDDKGVTHYAHLPDAVLFLFLPDIVGLTDRTIGVRQQLDLEVGASDSGVSHSSPLGKPPE